MITMSDRTVKDESAREQTDEISWGHESRLSPPREAQARENFFETFHSHTL